MKQEHRLVLAVVLCIAVVIVVQLLFPAPPPRKKPAVPPPAPAATRPGEPDAPGSGDADPADPAAAPEAAAGAEEPDPVPVQPLAAGRLVTGVECRGAVLDGVTLRGIAARAGQDPSDATGWLRFLDPPSEGRPGALGVRIQSRDLSFHDPERRTWRLVSAPGALPLVYECRVLKREREGRGIVLVKTFHGGGGEDDWHLDWTLTVRNEDAELAGSELTLRVRGAGGQRAPEEGTRDHLAGGTKLRGNASMKITSGPEIVSGQRDKEPVLHPGDVEWAASYSTYFAAILRAEPPNASAPLPAREVRWEAVAAPPGARDLAALPQCSPILVLPGSVPAVGREVVHRFRFFAGPRSEEVLDREEYRAYRPVQDKGIFGAIADVLFLILSTFHLAVPSWGVCIILLTLTVRAAMFPLSRRQQAATLEYARKMQKAKPRLDQLKEKYPDDARKRSEEQLKIMKEEGVPLMPGGCLLTFLQLPIWFALYGMLQANYDLRHAPFLWIEDLSKADRLWHMLPGVRGIPMVPNSLEWLNLLPLVMTLTWYYASKATMTPPADEQQAQMQKMMQWMPFIMLLFPGFYDMPSGLCLYITVSSAWGIVESRFLKKRLTAAAEAAAAAAAAAAPAPPAPRGRR